MRKGLYIMAILCGLVQASYAQFNNSMILKGNKLYEEKKYKEASQEYERAVQKNPNNLPGIFNLGNSLYQQGNMDASRKVLATAAKTATNKDAKGEANYNIGNSYMQEKKWEDAIDYYKQALRNNPQDADAKYNLSYATEMMKKQNGGGGKKNQKNKDQQNKDKQNQQNKDNQNKNQQNKDNQNKQGQNKDQQNQQNKDQEDKNDQQHPQSQPSKLSQKQADQLLNALEQEEKKLQDKKQKEKGVPVKMAKDW